MKSEIAPIVIDGKNGIVYNTHDLAGVREYLKNTEFLDAICDVIENDAMSLVADPLTKEGNKQIRENAAWVNKQKKLLETMRTESVKPIKDEPKLIEESVRPFVKRLTALYDKVIKPVKDIDYRADALRTYSNKPGTISFAPIEQLRKELDDAKAWDDSEEKWCERHEEAVRVKQDVINAIYTMLQNKEREEKEREELEELRRIKAESDRKKELEEAKERGRKEAIELATRKAETIKSETNDIAKEGKNESAYEQAYNDLQKAFRNASYKDPMRFVLDEIVSGNVRNVIVNF